MLRGSAGYPPVQTIRHVLGSLQAKYWGGAAVHGSAAASSFVMHMFYGQRTVPWAPSSRYEANAVQVEPAPEFRGQRRIEEGEAVRYHDRIGGAVEESDGEIVVIVSGAIADAINLARVRLDGFRPRPGDLVGAMYDGRSGLYPARSGAVHPCQHQRALHSDSRQATRPKITLLGELFPVQLAEQRFRKRSVAPLGQVADAEAVVGRVPAAAFLRIGARPVVERPHVGAMDSIENGSGRDLAERELALPKIRGRPRRQPGTQGAAAHPRCSPCLRAIPTAASTSPSLISSNAL